LVEQFFAAVPTDRMDEAALHQFRIRGKELRYALELLAGAFPARLRTTIYPVIEGLQNHLGVLEDLATSRDRLQQKTCDARAAVPWRRLLAKEEAKLEQTRKDFWAKYTRGFLRRLRDNFQAVLTGLSFEGERCPLLRREIVPPRPSEFVKEPTAPPLVFAQIKGKNGTSFPRRTGRGRRGRENSLQCKATEKKRRRL
jgi:hypothetical protein